MRKHESVVWLPPRSIGERAFAAEASLLALVQSPEGAHYARLSLDALPAVRSVRLVFDARDVTLLHVKLPPLSGAKLRQAIPNAVEDRILQDVGGCAFALGPTDEEGRRLVAVIDRSWLEFVLGAFERRGVRVASAWPAQLVAPLRDGELPLICIGNGIAARTGQVEGIGWTAGDTAAEREQAFASLLATVLAPPPAGGSADASGGPQIGSAGHAGEHTAADDAGPEAAAADPDAADAVSEHAAGGLHARRVRLFSDEPEWREPLVAAVRRLRVGAKARALPVPDQCPVDLSTAVQRTGMGRRIADIDWRAWRLPIWLGAGATAVFLLGLNLHWGKLASEKEDLRERLFNRYRQTFPDDRVVVDPVLQMERRVAQMRAGAGQSGPDDFLPLLSRFAQALGPQAAGALTGLEYRDGRLRVTFQPDLVAARSVRERMTAACQRMGLALRFEDGREQSAVVALL